jgi:hypothetical protein
MVSSGENVALDLPVFKDNRGREGCCGPIDLCGGPFSLLVITTFQIEVLFLCEMGGSHTTEVTKMRVSEETLTHQSLTDRTEILDSVRRQVRIPKRVDYDHVAYCCRCAEKFQKDLLQLRPATSA